MKKIIFITLLFCGLAFTAQSQSLQFSQVLLIGDSTTHTVPTRKVWKVVSFLANDDWLSGSSSGWATKLLKVKINGEDIILACSKNNPGYRTGYAAKTEFPIWLPSGTTVLPTDHCEGLSVIEFTVASQ